MSDYTPTNVEVRVAYVAYRSSADTLQQARTLHTPIFGPEFDRWLASVKAEAMETGYNLGFVDGVKQSKAEAWDEGHDAGESDYRDRVSIDEPKVPNPYRKVSK